ncbi:YbaK/prolyl-tRNA synthetase associated domain-containing protein, partial [Morganella morganii]|uniref:YbaK/EbsC family protein n=1 Tax=Morganella morganii TaxID=582 RepID=UPI0019F70082
MTPIVEKLTARLDEPHDRYRVVQHASAGQTEEVARVRGTHHGPGAKALVCHVKGNGVRQYVLAILPSDQPADLQALAKKTGGT